MPPRKKRATNAKSKPRSSGSKDSEAENTSPSPQGKMGPPSASKRTQRGRSRNQSKLDDSMKSAKSEFTANSEASQTPAELQAQQEYEIQLAFAAISSDILQGVQDSSAVTNTMKSDLLNMMRKAPRLYQKTLLSFIDQLLTIDIDETHLRNFYLLLTRFFNQIVQKRDRENGSKLIKSVIRHLLDIFHLQKLQKKLQERVGHFLALTINATAEKQAQDSATADDTNLNGKSAKAARVFTLFNDVRSREDQNMREQLVNTIIQMLSVTTSTTNVQANAIQMASMLSNYKDDVIFLTLMKLLSLSTSMRTRESIIKSFRAPYSEQALIFLGKRLRDNKPSLVKLIFEQLTSNGVKISNFPTSEARMLILTEGFTSNDPSVQKACINFLTPTVKEFAENNDIAGILKLIEARLAFGNQYYGRIPGYVTLAILEILDSDITLADYLEKVVMAKLRRLGGLPIIKKRADPTHSAMKIEREIDENDLIAESQHDIEMKEDEKEGDHAKTPTKSTRMDVDEETLPPITFEEVLLLRLAFELNRSTANQRSQYYLDRLEHILPEFRDYQLITYALCKMPELSLPEIDEAEQKIHPYPKGQTGFTRRAILGEWIKFSLQLNIADETIRQSLTTLCFSLVSLVEHSFSDYEHLLKKRTQLLKVEDDNYAASIVQAIVNSGEDDENLNNIEELLLQQDDCLPIAGLQQESENQQLEITIRTFENIGTARSLQEYCKPTSMEILTLDFDDVSQLAVTVAKTLIGDRIDDFQLKIMEAVSDIKETVHELDSAGTDAFATKNEGMFFSQLPVTQQPDLGPINFPQLRAKLMQKIEQKVEMLHNLGNDDSDFDMKVFNKTFSQLQLYVQLVEETHLKEKLSYKRALILCRTLLKQCRLKNANDQHVIDICETIIHPCVQKHVDKENMLIAFECIGLICLLDSDVFLSYSQIFMNILAEDLEPDKDNKREKVIAIKSVVDSLIIHGIDQPQLSAFFDTITGQYLSVRNRVLRQVSIEGVCKMLFTPKLCDQNDPRRVEAILAQLLLQFFDHTYSPKNSLVTSILNEFLKNFAPYSEQRCRMLLNAFTKIVYACMRERYGLNQACLGVGKAKKMAKKAVTAAAKKKKMVMSDSDQDSDFEASFMDYASDDSMFVEQKVPIRQICKKISLSQILSRIIILSRAYINSKSNEGFNLKAELTVEFFLRLLCMNNKLFQKTQIVKDVLIAVLEFVHVEQSDSLPQLRSVEKQWIKNQKMLLQSTQKVSQFQDSLSQRMQELEEIEEANDQIMIGSQNVIKAEGGGDVEMSHLKQGSQDEPEPEDSDEEGLNGFAIDELARYWDEHIAEVHVDRGKYDDRELLQMQQVWLDQLKSEGTKSALGEQGSATKSILKSPSNFNMRLGEIDATKSRLSTSQVKKPQKQVARARRGNRRQAAQVSSTEMVSGNRVTSLHSIEETKSGSAADPKRRRIRIVEENEDKRPQRLGRPIKGTTKSEVSETEEEENDTDEDEDESGESEEASNSDYQTSSAHAKAEIDDQKSSSEHDHEGMVSDNLGAIAQNIARDYAKTKQRLSNGSDARKSIGETIKVNILNSSSGRPQNAQTKHESLILSRDKDGVVISEHMSSMKKRSAGSSAKKQLTRDFNDVAETAVVEKKSSIKKVGVATTRKRQKAQSSLSNSMTSNANDDSDGMYDFMDGKLTKQLKQQKRQATAAKEQSQAVNDKGDEDIKPVRSRSRRNRQQQ